MKATASRHPKTKRIVVLVECENKKDERIVTAISNIPAMGYAIQKAFGNWDCPFFAALNKLGVYGRYGRDGSESDQDTQKLMNALSESF